MQKCSFLKSLVRNERVTFRSNLRGFSAAVSSETESPNKPEQNSTEKKLSRRDYRFIFPEFLPDPNPSFRNALAEKLQRKDLLSRRNQVEIPGTSYISSLHCVSLDVKCYFTFSFSEFYVGSYLGVTVADPHSPHPNKLSRCVIGYLFYVYLKRLSAQKF